MTKASERETVKAEHVNGGAGFIMKEALITGEELGEHCKMFSRVTIKPGCELGHHEHVRRQWEGSSHRGGGCDLLQGRGRPRGEEHRDRGPGLCGPHPEKITGRTR